jgi:NADH-quinone oxidoreductase subunit G
VALVSTWGSNEELAALKRALPPRCTTFVKSDHARQAGERGDDDLLIRADKNPNRSTASALFPLEDDGHGPFIADTDVVLVWGEGFDFGRVPAGAKLIVLDAYEQPANARADVFIPVSIQTERSGHYTNFQGVESPFSACFGKPSTVADAEAVFAAIAVTEGAPA